MHPVGLGDPPGMGPVDDFLGERGLQPVQRLVKVHDQDMQGSRPARGRPR